MKPYQYVPGVPAAGHIASGGFWHPGRIDGCTRCEPPKRTPARPKRKKEKD